MICTPVLESWDESLRSAPMANSPSKRFLIELAKALRESRYPNVAGRLCAGLLWAIWPEWYDKNVRRHG
jgi:hypothetical protein